MSEFKRASWSRRFIAYVIDNVIVELFWIVLIAGLIIFTSAEVSDIFDIIDPENELGLGNNEVGQILTCLLYTSPSPRDRTRSRMPSSA